MEMDSGMNLNVECGLSLNVNMKKPRNKIQEPKKHQIVRNKKASTGELESGKNSFKMGEKR